MSFVAVFHKWRKNHDPIKIAELRRLLKAKETNNDELLVRPNAFLAAMFGSNTKAPFHFTFQDVTYTSWWPKSVTPRAPSSPLMFTSDAQRKELLYRFAPLAAVVRKKSNDGKLVLIINSSLIVDSKLEGKLFI